MNRDCELIKDLIPLYVDGICSEHSKQMVEEHIANCSDCKNEVEMLQRTIDLPMDKDTTKLKGFKDYVKMKIWSRVITIILVFFIIYIPVSFFLSFHWGVIWPKADAEGIKENVSVVKIDDEFYIHQQNLFGFGEVVDITNYEDQKQGICRFYLGEQGIEPYLKTRSYVMREKYTKLVNNDEALEHPITKIVYCRSNGEELTVLWDASQDLEEYKGVGTHE